MATWNELLSQFKILEKDKKSVWFRDNVVQTLTTVSNLRQDSNVILYGSAFLQKPDAPSFSTQIMREDINGIMSSLYKLDWDKPLTLVLHTPGGVTNATETIVEYLRSKFKDIEVIIPTYALSAGTMIALASNLIIMGRQSQLGPIDPQMPYTRGYISARAVVEQFNRAKQETQQDRNLAITWAPILASLGPSLITEAQNALDYGEKMVAKWLEEYMFKDITDPVVRSETAQKAASYFNDATKHKSHGRRIGREEARQQGIIVKSLEDNQTLQESVLTIYHLMSILFEQTFATKIICNHQGRFWLKYQLPHPK